MRYLQTSRAIPLLFAGVMLFMVSCGWQLRGLDTPKHSTTGEKTSFKLILKKRNHALSAVIKRLAREGNYALDSTSNTWLIIENERLQKRPMTVTQAGVAAQYQLTLNITFNQKNSSGEILVPTKQITSWRNYDFDTRLLMSKSAEEQALVKEMREELTQLMLGSLR